MEHNQYDLLEVLEQIEPAELDYQQWLNVGMALELEGYSVDTWDAWSRKDPGRYHSGECRKSGPDFPVPALLSQEEPLYSMRESRDGRLLMTREPPWDGMIPSEEGVVIDRNWVEEKDVLEPSHWNPAGELIRYLEALFEAGENVGYVVKSWQKEEKWLPADKGAYDRTAGELIEALSACGGDIGKVLEDYNGMKQVPGSALTHRRERRPE